MRWMDGWSGNFFFKLISRKLLKNFSNLFRILLECVSRYLLRKTQKIQKKIDFSKIFAKIRGWFFPGFFEHKFAISRKKLDIFFLIVFGPSKDYKTSSKKSREKSHNSIFGDFTDFGGEKNIGNFLVF